LLSEIGINLAVPCKVFALANELSQLCQIAGRKRFYRLLNFGKAHLPHLIAKGITHKSGRTNYEHEQEHEHPPSRKATARQVSRSWSLK
jgi:hypothetical protein